MIQTARNTAILIFGDHDKITDENKQFHLYGEQYKLASKLSQHTIQTVKQSNLPYFHFHTGIQIGDSFEERLYSAFDQLFHSGYDSVIAVGLDCPDLNVKLIHEAAAHLNQYDSVLGPDFRGGAYLLGFTKQSFYSIQFLKLDWQSKNLYAHLSTEITLNGYSIKRLRQFSDINHISELTVYLNTNQNWFTILLFSFFSVKRRTTSPYLIYKTKELHSSFALRGPPIVAA